MNNFDPVVCKSLVTHGLETYIQVHTAISRDFFALDIFHFSFLFFLSHIDIWTYSLLRYYWAFFFFFFIKLVIM